MRTTLFHREAQAESTAAGADSTISGVGDGSPSLRVLLIDDNKREVPLVEANLERAAPGRYSVDWVDRFELGLKEVLRGRHDVYLVDYELGAQTGDQLIKEARQAGCRAPMIVLTGARDPMVDQAALAAGASGFTSKGASDPAALDRTIRYAIAEASSRDELARATRRLAVLDEIGQLLASNALTADIMADVARIISEGFELPFVTIYSLEGEGERLVLEARRGYEAARAFIDVSTGPVRAALQLGRPQIMTIVSVPHLRTLPSEPTQELCIPLRASEASVGLLAVGMSTAPSTLATDQPVLSAIGARVARALVASDARIGWNLGWRREPLATRWRQDDDIVDRSSFDTALAHRLAALRQLRVPEGAPVAVLLFADSTPATNGTLLQSVAHAARASCGPDALLGDYGKGVLVAAVQGVDRDRVTRTAKSILTTVREGSPQTSPQDPGPMPDVVCGCSIRDGCTSRPGELLDAAETALQQATRMRDGAFVLA